MKDSNYFCFRGLNKQKSGFRDVLQKFKVTKKIKNSKFSSDRTKCKLVSAFVLLLFVLAECNILLRNGTVTIFSPLHAFNNLCPSADKSMGSQSLIAIWQILTLNGRQNGAVPVSWLYNKKLLR